MIDEIKKHMLSNGAVGAMMSGSGPTVLDCLTMKIPQRKRIKPCEAHILPDRCI